MIAVVDWSLSISGRLEQWESNLTQFAVKEELRALLLTAK